LGWKSRKSGRQSDGSDTTYMHAEQEGQPYT